MPEEQAYEELPQQSTRTNKRKAKQLSRANVSQDTNPNPPPTPTTPRSARPLTSPVTQRSGPPAKSHLVVVPRYRPPEEDDEPDEDASDEDLSDEEPSEDSSEKPAPVTKNRPRKRVKLSRDDDAKYRPSKESESSSNEYSEEEETSEGEPVSTLQQPVSTPGEPPRGKRRPSAIRGDDTYKPSGESSESSDDEGAQTSKLAGNLMSKLTPMAYGSLMSKISPMILGSVLTKVEGLSTSKPTSVTDNKIQGPKSPTTPSHHPPIIFPITPITEPRPEPTTQPGKTGPLGITITIPPSPDPTPQKPETMPDVPTKVFPPNNKPRPRGLTGDSPQVIFPTPKVKRDPRVRDWPPYPGTAYCMHCFTLDVLKAFRLRRNTLHTLRVLGGSGALRSFIDLQRRMDKLELDATEFLDSGKDLLREGDLIRSPSSGLRPLAFHDQLPPDIKGLIQLRYFAHELAGPDRELQNAFPEVAGMLEAMRMDLNLSTNQISNLEGRYIGSIYRHPPSRKYRPGSPPPQSSGDTNLDDILDGKAKIPLLKTGDEDADSTKEGAIIIAKLKDLTTQFLTWERENATNPDGTPIKPTIPSLTWRRETAVRHRAEPHTASLIRQLEKPLGIPIIPTTGNENLNHHMDVKSYLRIERRIYDYVQANLAPTELNLRASESSSHPKWPCTNCSGSDASNKARAMRPYPRDIELDSRRAWAQTVRWVFPSMLGGKVVSEVKTEEFVELLKGEFKVGESQGDEEIFSEDEGWVEKAVDKNKKKKVSDVQNMRGFEFVVCNVEADDEVPVPGGRWKTRVVLLRMKNVFDEIREVRKA